MRICTGLDAAKNMKSGYRNPARARLWVTIPAICLVACGGGGGGTSGPPPGTPTGPNHPPLLVSPNGDQVAIVGHPYDYDITKQGGVFSDPDGDRLSYEVRFGQNTFGMCHLSMTGPRATGVPGAEGQCDVVLIARDGRGGEATDSFNIRLRHNQPPTVVAPNPNREVGISSPIDYDAIQGGQTFTDADGHALSYEVTLLSAPAGFSVQGTRVVGALTAPGYAKVKVVARDAFGGVGEDSFAFVVPTPIAARPTLPATPFVYDDRVLPLPDGLKPTPGGTYPFADTTPMDNEITDAGATLGRVLFYDKRLSITNTHSCGSCHEQARGFASSQRFPTGSLGVPTKRSSMALTNVRYNGRNQHFLDARVGPLEDLALMPIMDRDELGTISLASLEAELAAADYYPPLFSVAFGSPEITPERMAKALAQFLRSMLSFETRWDRAFLSMQPIPAPGPAGILTAQELRGEDVFREQGCDSCHNRTGFTSPGPENNGLDAVLTDPGAGEGRFRTTSLKNIAVSGPYMHDGRFATLREVIDHYDHGVKNARFVNPTLIQQRNMSEDDKAALEAFFNLLTDDAFLTNPKFSDPFQ